MLRLQSIKPLALAGAALLSSAFTSPATAQLGASVGNALSIADPARMQQLMSGLDLSPQQQQRLDRLTAVFSNQHAADIARAQEMVRELQRIEDGGGEIDANALVALAGRYQETLLRLVPATQQFLANVMDVLNTDQRDRFRQALGGIGVP